MEPFTRSRLRHAVANDTPETESKRSQRAMYPSCVDPRWLNKHVEVFGQPRRAVDRQCVPADEEEPRAVLDK